MTSRSETGHVKNVANFETMISFCTAYGSAYNPSKETLKITALNAHLSLSRTSISECTNTKNHWDLAINERQIAFTPLKPLATRMINALKASGASTQTIDDAQSINKKIQGGRSSAKPAGEEGEEKRTASTSQQSYDNLLENFARFVDLLASEASYKPNEEELKTESLNTYVQQLRTENTKVIEAATVNSNAMISRDNILYAVGSGLVDRTADVKVYVKSLYGASSPQYKQISKLQFTRPKN